MANGTLKLFGGIVLAAVCTSSLMSPADARSGGITGSQGAGARTGFGPPIGYEPTPAYSGRSVGGVSAYSDGNRCSLQRSSYFGYPAYIRVCN